MDDIPTYQISHITDLLKMEPAHLEEFAEQLPELVETISAGLGLLHAAEEVAGAPKTPPQKALPCVEFKPDGLTKTSISYEVKKDD